MKKWWNKKNTEQKKWFLIKSISTLIFLLVGLIFGIIVMISHNWYFMEFITNPTVDLVILIMIAIIIFCLSTKFERKKQ